MNSKKIFLKGIFKENPILVSLLGLCPTLAVTTNAASAVGLGLATAFVLVSSNIAISLLQNVIPKAVKLPCVIVIIAGFVAMIEFLVKGYIPSLHRSLGTFLPLIAVNCIVFSRAEMFACKNKVMPSVIDALGMGAGFTLALFIMGAVREIAGSGTLFAGTPLELEFLIPSVNIFIMPAGGFFILGVIIAALNFTIKKKPPESPGCKSCTQACPLANKGGSGK